MSIIAKIFLLIVIIVVLIFLQIYLSRTRKRWIGLTLPTLSLLVAIIITIVSQPIYYSETEIGRASCRERVQLSGVAAV